MMWPTAKAELLCEITSSKRIFATDYVSEGVPFFRGKEISEKFNRNQTLSTELFISRNKFEEIASKFGAPSTGDLLLTSVGTLGNPYLVKDGDEFYFKDGNITWFRAFSGINSTYLYFWIQSPTGRAQLGKSTIGTSQSAYTIELLKRMDVSVPPLQAQYRIADILSAYDDLIENNRRRMALLEDAARQLYREWFVRLRFPGHEHTCITSGVPDGWERKSVVHLTNFLNRGIAPHYDDDAEGLVINQKCIRSGRLNLSLARHQSREFKPERQVQHGDVLVNSTGEGTLGRVAQVLAPIDNCTVDTHVTITRPATGIGIHYFGQALMEWEPRFSTMGRGATNQTELSPGQIGGVQVLVPPRSLMQQFEDVAASSFRQVWVLIEQNEKLRAARDLLLPRLMSGEIVV
jgi:type I restriction enzyme S subunit